MDDTRTTPALTAESPALPRPTGRWESACANSLAEAEELLDWAEAGGCRECRLLVDGGSQFVVKWR